MAFQDLQAMSNVHKALEELREHAQARTFDLADWRHSRHTQQNIITFGAGFVMRKKSVPHTQPDETAAKGQQQKGNKKDEVAATTITATQGETNSNKLSKLQSPYLVNVQVVQNRKGGKSSKTKPDQSLAEVRWYSIDEVVPTWDILITALQQSYKDENARYLIKGLDGELSYEKET